MDYNKKNRPLDYAKKHYWANQEFHLERQYKYRYIRGNAQKIADDNWDVLCTMNDMELNEWAKENLPITHFKAFKTAVNKNRLDGRAVIAQRIKEMAEFAKSYKRRIPK